MPVSYVALTLLIIHSFIHLWWVYKTTLVGSCDKSALRALANQ